MAGKPSILPYTTKDLHYDNAKFRRRSAVRVVSQAVMSSGIRKNCGSCGLGRFLALLMLIGLGILGLSQTSDTGKSNLKVFPKFNITKYSANKWVKESPFFNKFWKQHRLPNLPPKLRLGLLTELTNNGSSKSNVELPFFSDRNSPDDLLWIRRQAAVVNAFRHSWKGYKEFAMGYDELRPLSRTGVDGLGGLGATIVDSLDTALIMGLDDIAEQAGLWIEKELPIRLSQQGQVNLFETTIRVLGGLLSAFHLSGGDTSVVGIDGSSNGTSLTPGPKPEVYKNLAIDLGDRLMAAFTSSPSQIPYSDVILSQHSAHPAGNDGGASSTSEATTLQLEFWYLSKITGDPKYGKVAMRVLEHVKNLPKVEGLVPIFMSPHTGEFQGNNIRLGSRGDSYYEYLLKVWIQQGGIGYDGQHVRYLREMYDEAMKGVKHLLVGKSVPNGLVYVGELPNGDGHTLSPKMDHLVCFLAGNLALGATRGFTEREAKESGLMHDKDLKDLSLAKELARTCYEMYNVTATGLAPEIAYFRTSEGGDSFDGGKPDAKYRSDIIIKPLDRHNLLRPETVESLFILYRITGNSMYREWGWKIFEAFEKHSRVASGGYSSIDDVTVTPSAPKRDKMETFFLGETLKYLYLLFGEDNVLPLNYFVFNTEAHPLPISWEGASKVLSSSS